MLRFVFQREPYPLYQVGADATLADMVPSEKRTEAFTINRMANNARFAMGPAIGGFFVTRSYNMAFYCAGIGFISYSFLLFFLAKETLIITSANKTNITGMDEVIQSFSRVARDKTFVTFVIAVSIGLIAPT